MHPIVQPGNVRFRTRRDAAAWLAWLREEQLFRQRLAELRAELRRTRRGRPWLSYGPAQLVEHASDPARAGRLLGSLRRLESVLPPSLRGVAWLLVLNPDVKITLPPGPTIPRATWDRLARVARARLFDWGYGGLAAAEQKFLTRTLAKLDPGAPPLVVAAWRGQPPALTTPAAVNATAAAVGSWTAGASTAGFPVVGYVASVTGAESVLVAPIPPPRPSSFRFVA